MSFIEDNPYLVAWLVYILAGLGFCRYWWHITKLIQHPGRRELLRGFTWVIIFTPWPQGASYAPAILVLLMDLLLDGTENGLQGGLALLISSFFMSIVLAIRQIRRTRSKNI